KPNFSLLFYWVSIVAPRLSLVHDLLFLRRRPAPLPVNKYPDIVSVSRVRCHKRVPIRRHFGDKYHGPTIYSQIDCPKWPKTHCCFARYPGNGYCSIHRLPPKRRDMELIEYLLNPLLPWRLL